MKAEIIKQMTEVVRDIMTSFQSDFEQYDMAALDGYDGKFLWFVAPSHTHLALIDEHHLYEQMCEPSGERFIYSLLQGNATPDCCMAMGQKDELVFYCDGEKMDQITCEEAQHIWKAIKDFTLFQWQIKTGRPLPENMRVPIKFTCSLSYVKEQLRFSAENGGNLLERLRNFRNYRKINSTHVIEIGKDFAEHSFVFASCYREARHETDEKICSLNGGLIYYHGKWNTHT